MIQITVSELLRCFCSQSLWVSSEITCCVFDWDRTSSALRTARRNGPSSPVALRNLNAAVVCFNRAPLCDVPTRCLPKDEVPVLRLQTGCQFPTPEHGYIVNRKDLTFFDGTNCVNRPTRKLVQILFDGLGDLDAVPERLLRTADSSNHGRKLGRLDCIGMVRTRKMVA